MSYTQWCRTGGSSGGLSPLVVFSMIFGDVAPLFILKKFCLNFFYCGKNDRKGNDIGFYN